MPGTTPNYGFTYPLSSDNLSDGATQIQTFATQADTAFLDLRGGTTGQYLTKQSNTQMDFQWTTLPVSESGVPVAGVGYYFGPRNQFMSTGATSTGSMTANYMLLIPVFTPKATAIDRIAVEVTTLAAASTVRLGVYDNDGTGGAPGTLLNDFGTVSAASTGIKELTVSATLPTGLSYLAIVSSSATVALRTMTLLSNGFSPLAFQDNTTDAFGTALKWWGRATVTGALPTPAGATLQTLGTAGLTTGVPIITMRAA